MRDAQLWGYDTASGTWIKYLVDASGHPQVDVLSTALPTGAATSAKQDTELTELQAKLETAELSIEAITKYLNINVKNLPTEYPLTAAQVADLKIITSYPDPIISQTDPTKLKHIPHGYYATGLSYLPLAVDSAGKQLVTLSSLARLDDIDDVDVPTPTDQYLLYWDAATSKWKCKALTATDIPNLDTAKVTTGIFAPARVGPTIQDADADTKIQTEEAADEDKIRMDVKGVEAFLLSDIGVLTLAKQSRVRAYKSAADQAIATNSDVKVVLDGETYDNQNEFDSTTNYRFTAKEAGYYLLMCIGFIYPTVADKYYSNRFYKNGVYLCAASLQSSFTFYLGAVHADVVYLAANDYIEFYFHQTSGANATLIKGTEACWFAAHKLS